MKIRIITLLIASLVLGGCIRSLCGAGDSLSSLTNDLKDLLQKHPQNPQGVEAELAKLADRAQTAAKGESNKQTAVALYRIAAIAAWQAGSAADTKILDITKDGEAACTALPPNQARPTDCAIISLTAPFAVADDWQGKLSALEQKYRGVTAAHDAQCNTLAANARQSCLNTKPKLPQADGDTLKDGVFRGFRDQFDAVTNIRGKMDSEAAIDEALKKYTDNERVIIYCSAVESWSLFQDCDGSTDSALAPLNADLQSMLCRLSLTEQQCSTPGHPAPRDVDCARFARPRIDAIVDAKN